MTAAGNGGMIAMDDPDWFDQTLVRRRWGRRSETYLFGSRKGSDDRFGPLADGTPYDLMFVFDDMGYNFEPSEIMAAYGLVQMDKLDEFNARRRHAFAAARRGHGGAARTRLPDRARPRVSTPRGCATCSVSPTGSTAPSTQEFFLERSIPTRMVWTGNILRQPGFADISHRAPERRASECGPDHGPGALACRPTTASPATTSGTWSRRSATGRPRSDRRPAFRRLVFGYGIRYICSQRSYCLHWGTRHGGIARRQGGAGDRRQQEHRQGHGAASRRRRGHHLRHGAHPRRRCRARSAACAAPSPRSKRRAAPPSRWPATTPTTRRSRPSSTGSATITDGSICSSTWRRRTSPRWSACRSGRSTSGTSALPEHRAALELRDDVAGRPDDGPAGLGCGHQHLLARRETASAVGAVRGRQGRDRQADAGHRHRASRAWRRRRVALARVSCSPRDCSRTPSSPRTAPAPSRPRHQLRGDAEVQRAGRRRARLRPEIMENTGGSYWSSRLAREYGFTEDDGHLPPEIERIQTLMSATTCRTTGGASSGTSRRRDADNAHSSERKCHDRSSRPDLCRRPCRAADRRLPALRGAGVAGRVRPVRGGPRGVAQRTQPLHGPARGRRAGACLVRRGDGRHVHRPGSDRPWWTARRLRLRRRNRELEGEGIVAEVLFPDFQNSNEPPWGAAFPFPDSTRSCG